MYSRLCSDLTSFRRVFIFLLFAQFVLQWSFCDLFSAYSVLSAFAVEANAVQEFFQFHQPVIHAFADVHLASVGDGMRFTITAYFLALQL